MNNAVHHIDPLQSIPNPNPKIIMGPDKLILKCLWMSGRLRILETLMKVKQQQ